ncbi:MAG: TetR/AcrR family transcriptional regulator [Proteobacteria bacterium]|nr:TetR/AcrR family transcriptional regulator [Pseudomonadota bacterium]
MAGHEPRKQPKQARARATVDAIVQATARVLVEDGYDSLSTNRVAKRAGVSIGSLYQYFPDKESLVLAVAEKHGEAILADLRARLESVAGLPLDQALESTIRAFIDVHLVDPELHRVIHFDAHTLTRARVRQGALTAQRMVHAALVERQDTLLIRDADAAAHVVVCTVEAVANSLLVGPVGADSEAVVRETCDLVLRYLGLSAAED